MTLHITQLPRLIARRRASAALGVVIILMMWGAVLVNYRDNFNQDYRDVGIRNQNYAMLLEENILRSIGEIDKAILYLRRSIETAPKTTDYVRMIKTTDVLSEIIVQVAIIDAKGISRASNALSEPAKLIDISDREHFQVHLRSNKDKLFISKPVVGRASGKWSVQFTRRISNADGAFAGVVVASMDPAHFTKFYDKIDLGTTTSVAMVGGDGVVRSSGGGTADRLPLGQDLNGSNLLSTVLSQSDGAFLDTTTFPGEALFVTARKVKDYPLWVTVSTEASEIYQPSWASLRRHAAIAAVLTILVLIALEQILRAEAKAEQKAQQLQLTLEHISQGIMLVTKEREIPILNRRCGELLELPKEMVKSPPQLDKLVEYQVCNGDLAFAAGEPPQADYAFGEPLIFDYASPDGKYIEVRKSHLPDGGFVQTLTDITSRREAEAHIARLASEDPLTKLPNRRVFRTALEEFSRDNSSESGRGSLINFAVLFLDMDRFKVVNDTLGHRIGDLLLIEVSHRLKGALGRKDILARLGGDEFAVLLPAVASRGEIDALASNMIQAMAQPFQVDRHLVRSGISVGIAVAPQDGMTADELLMAADLALYAVKAERRGSYRFYQRTLNDEANDRRELEEDLRQALERGQLELHYQPVLDLQADIITGFEALARWNHPEKGTISPSKFIPVAEDCGLILPLGEWALTEACRTAAQWPDELDIAVNLSPVQLTSPDLVSNIVRILGETGLHPNRLTLEITERTLVEDSDRTLSVLNELKQLGIQISLDDFGTGYSSLSYLRSYPFDTIKIDRTFVSNLREGAESNVIVQAIILIATRLGMRTIAEGVETELQKQILNMLGCHEMQGYLLNRPVPITQVPMLLAQWLYAKTASAYGVAPRRSSSNRRSRLVPAPTLRLVP